MKTTVFNTLLAHALPSDFKLPSEPVSCKCENHLDKLESEVELPVSAKKLYYTLFDDENPNYMDIWERKTLGNKSKGKITRDRRNVIDNKNRFDHDKVGTRKRRET